MPAPVTRFARLDPRAFALPAELASRLLTPALVVHLDHVRENLRRVIARAGGDPERWRPHVKTTKIPEVFAEVAAAGVRSFKCATTRELAGLLDVMRERDVAGGDVLVAYPLGGPGLARVGALARERPETAVSVLAEDPDAVADVPREVSVFVDVNPGMNRTGVLETDEEAILAVARAAGDRFRGVHFYDGHLCGDDLDARRRAIFAGYDRLLELVALLRGEGLAVGEIVTSGTPAFLHALAYEPFGGLEGTRHRISPGTVVFHDLRSEEENPDLELLPAALVASRVISHPTPDVATCDAGSKSIAAEAGDPCAFAIGRPGLEALAPSEEHLPLLVREGERPPRGEILHLVPRHVCPTTNLHEQAVLLEGGELRAVVPVSARAHDVLLEP